MKNRIILTCALFLVLAAGLQASPKPGSTTSKHPGAKIAAKSSVEPISIPVIFGDPAGDGTNSCSVADCRLCNDNGLMCTPTAGGCNCDYWIFLES